MTGTVAQIVGPHVVTVAPPATPVATKKTGAFTPGVTRADHRHVATQLRAEIERWRSPEAILTSQHLARSMADPTPRPTTHLAYQLLDR